MVMSSWCRSVLDGWRARLVMFYEVMAVMTSSSSLEIKKEQKVSKSLPLGTFLSDGKSGEDCGGSNDGII